MIYPAIGGVALGLGLSLGANVSGWVLAGYGALFAAAGALMLRSPDGLRRALRGLERAWRAPGQTPRVRRHARLKLVGSALILALLFAGAAMELA